jgi:type IV secretory pathway VirB2 component (pilin)
MKKSMIGYLALIGLALFIGPELALASVESTLTAIQNKLISTILPLCAILGLVFGAFSFFMGNPNARAHVVLAIIGAVIGFGAPSIVAFVRSLVH